MDPSLGKISDDFWAAVEPLLPPRSRVQGHAYQRQPGGGRKPTPARQVFEAVIYILRTGTPWKELPKPLGSASAVHRWFLTWQDAGLFHKLWDEGLAEHYDMRGVAWRWLESDDTPSPHSQSPVARRRDAPRFASASSLLAPRRWQPAPMRRAPRRSSSF